MDSGPIIGFSGRNGVPPHRNDPDLALDLSLGTVEQDFETILAVKQRHIDKFEAAIGPVFGKGKQLPVAIKFGIPAAGQFSPETGAVEIVGTLDRAVGYQRPATGNRLGDQRRGEGRNVAEGKMGGP